jgi:hypothetical protein
MPIMKKRDNGFFLEKSNQELENLLEEMLIKSQELSSKY